MEIMIAVMGVVFAWIGIAGVIALHAVAAQLKATRRDMKIAEARQAFMEC